MTKYKYRWWWKPWTWFRKSPITSIPVGMPDTCKYRNPDLGAILSVNGQVIGTVKDWKPVDAGARIEPYLHKHVNF